MSHFPTFYLFFITGFEEPVSYHLLQTSSFHNHSWVHLSSGWLGELQIHRWNSSSDAIIYLYPWSRGNFSNRELVDLERFFRVNSIEIQEFYTNYFMSEGEFSSIAGENKVNFLFL
ncbi:hypothetical protein GHT09_004169 [Marmota monax]|uniref:MHC class I-like antigen recognition-like domain-containing protein n=1 Tax=Marmota monax TaxID=9995 RepID=A0A834V7D5_MARMO|nr:hypothetical protein GHT09_004169 [Marmota monax]